MKLVISRKRWLRGEGEDESKLYRSSDRKMCCLGFYCRKLGLKVSEIKDITDPKALVLYSTPSRRKELLKQKIIPEWLLENDGGSDVEQAIYFNDLEVSEFPEKTEKSREKRIKNIFAQHGVEVEFKD